uniref:TNFAIP3 interacting protein 3 n=1 Tax=Oryzias latipes TaxID=8090 RepID=A0A3P9K5X5_ORYLA
MGTGLFLQSLQENSEETTSVKTRQRLYPSLPNADRYEICLPVGSSREGLRFSGPKCKESPNSSQVGLKAQIVLLEEQRKELLSINKKWAKEYRTMVQYYKEKVRYLKAVSLQDSSEEEAGDEGEKRVTFHVKKADRRTGEGKAAVVTAEEEEEAEELRLLNSTLTRRGQHQHEEIRRLNKALEEALCGSRPGGGNGETLPDIWKHQAEVYKEDFLKERSDRERLKEKYLELEKRSRKAQEELRLLKSQVIRMKPTHTCSCVNPAKSPAWDICSVNRQQRRYTADSKC